MKQNTFAHSIFSKFSKNPESSLEQETRRGWQSLRRKVATGMTFLMLTSAGIGMLHKPGYTNPRLSTNSALITQDEDNKEKKSVWDKIRGVVRRDKQEEKKERERKDGKPGIRGSNYTIRPLEVIVGNDKPRYLKHGQLIEIPYDKTFRVTPQTNKQGMRTEFLLKLPGLSNHTLNEKYRTDDKGYICDTSGNRVVISYGRIDLEELGIKPGQRVVGQMTYETPTRAFQTAEIIIRRGDKPTPTKPVITPEARVKEAKPKSQAKPSPKPSLEKIKEHFVRGERQKEKEQAKNAGLFLLKAGYVLENETAEIRETSDPERNSSGFLGEAVFANKNYQVWGTFLHLGYDDKILVPGHAQLRNVFNEMNMGFELKHGFFVVGAEYIKTSNEWVPDVFPVWSPPMNKYDYNGFFGGAGVGLGNFNESFVECLYYYGKGSLKEKISIPGQYFLNDLTIDSEALKESFYKIHGRLDLKDFYVEGIYTQGRYDNTAKTLNGEAETIGGKIGVSLGLISPKLSNAYIGAFFHKLTRKDNNLEFSNELWGPMLIIYLPNKIRK